MVFQFFQLLPTLTIVENVLLPMDFSRKWTPRQRYERAIGIVGTNGGSRPGAQAAGGAFGRGKQQRAAIARAPG